MIGEAKKKRSIAKRLSVKLRWRLLFTFIAIDVILVVICSATALFICEYRAAKTNTSELYKVSAADEGAWDLDPFERIFPVKTRIGARSFKVSWDEWSPSTFTYNIYFAEQDELYVARYDLAPWIEAGLIILSVLLAIETLTLLQKSHRDSKLVRKMLSPISDFAAATESLGAISDSLKPDELSKLRGALDGISGNALDTRLDVDSASGELRELAAAINGMLDRVSEAYAAQIRFVSDASHELRTPIAVIQGYAGLLDRWGKRDEKILQEGIDAIVFESESMKQLVERLLFLARGDSGKLEMKSEPFDLGELCEETVSEYKLIDPDHEYDKETPTAGVTADRAQIKETLRVLMDNARKYTDAGGNISVRCGFNDNNEPYFSVTDTGCGIAADDLPRVFERFHRTDSSRARSSGGAGLGLAIARRIVTASGGRIEATSRLGIGTRMTVVLPPA